MSILDMIDGTLRDYETSADAMRWVPEEKRPAIPTADEFALVAQALGADMQRFAQGFRSLTEAMAPIIHAQMQATARFTHRLHRSLHPEQHRRCTTCHPWRKPKPLAVDGREYQRRLKARRRRRR